MDLYCDELAEALFRFVHSNTNVYDEYCEVLEEPTYDLSMAQFVESRYKNEFKKYCSEEFNIIID